MKLGMRGLRAPRLRRRLPPLPYETRDTYLLFRPASGGTWTPAAGRARRVPGLNRVVHSVVLTGLEPDTAYEFRLPNYVTPCVYCSYTSDPTTTLVVYWHTFQPLPSREYTDAETSSEVHSSYTLPTTLAGFADGAFVVAQVSDTHGLTGGKPGYFGEIASQGAQLIVHSGDMASNNGGELDPIGTRPETWYQFFDHLNHARRPDDEAIIPILPNLGNHEAYAGGAGIDWSSSGLTGHKPNFETHERGDTEQYYCLFERFPGLTGYGVVDCGDYASVWVMDPGISTSIYGPQTAWLADTLAERAEVPHKLFTMHYSAYHTGRRADLNYHIGLREEWHPLWLQYGRDCVVLVGHDHVYSRTPRIISGAISSEPGIVGPDGVLYVGCGPTGAGAREGRNPNVKWWIDVSRASEWMYFGREQSPNNPEYRGPDPADGTTFDDDLVRHYLLLELEADKRTIRAIDWTGDEFDTLVEAL